MVKSVQILVFASLIAVLLWNRYHGTSHIGKLPIVIAIFAVLNGVFAIIRIAAIFPHASQENFTVFDVFTSLENLAFFGCNWFFCIKYYETASDLEHMLAEDPS